MVGGLHNFQTIVIFYQSAQHFKRSYFQTSKFGFVIDLFRRFYRESNKDPKLMSKISKPPKSNFQDIKAKLFMMSTNF